jgi:hypothetical protein
MYPGPMEHVVFGGIIFIVLVLVPLYMVIFGK